MQMSIGRAALLPALMMALAACGSSSVGPPQAATAPAATASPVPTAAAQAAAATASPVPTAAAQAATSPALVLATVGAKPTAVVQLTATPIGPAAQAPAATSAPPAGVEAVPHVRQAIADLAARLSVEPGAISVLRAEEVEWPDGSVGCPREDMSYTQALVNGVFVQLAAGGQSYNYHGRAGDEPFLCTSPGEVLPEDLPPELRGGGGADT